MKKFKKLKWFVSVLLILVFGGYGFNSIMLNYESDKIKAPGEMIEVDGNMIHVYSEGDNNKMPALVFMSGSSTVAPVYDFKTLYKELSDRYRIVVVEKPGYGYSPEIDSSRNIEVLNSEVRGALHEANIKGPYVLVPHSMSGIEAIYYAQMYPEEVAAIIGLDMFIPSYYKHFDFSDRRGLVELGGLARDLSIFRIPFVYPLSKLDLTKDEIKQQKYLRNINALNETYSRENKYARSNSLKVKELGKLEVPLLMFTSNGKGLGKDWIKDQHEFASQNDGKVVELNCDHYIHYFKKNKIIEEMDNFLNQFQILE